MAAIETPLPAPIADGSSPSASRAITCEPLSEPSVSATSSNGVSRKSSSALIAESVPSAATSLPGPRLLSASFSEPSDTAPRLIGVSNDSPLSDGSTSEMPLSPPMVTSLPVLLPASTNSSSDSSLPPSSTAELPPAAGWPAIALSSRVKSSSRLKFNSSNLVPFASLSPFFFGIGVLACSPSWMSLSARRMSLSVTMGLTPLMPITVPDSPGSDWPRATSLKSTSPPSSSVAGFGGEDLAIRSMSSTLNFQSAPSR